jgi:hypothetical protein
MVKMNQIIKYNKKGWIRLVEVFIAIMLLTGVLLIVVTRNSPNNNNFQEEMSKKELAILRDIELNNSLRTEILAVSSENLPVEWENFGSGLQNVRNRITYLTPKNLECKAKICLMNESCIMEESSGEDLYAESVVISADVDTYSPRQLKLFCMSK